MPRESFGDWIRSLRDEKRVPLRVVAAKIGIDSTLLSKFERGERLPTDVQGEALAGYYSVPKADLQSQLLAARILRDHGSDPSLQDAIVIVREGTHAQCKYPRKPVKYTPTRKRRS